MKIHNKIFLILFSFSLVLVTALVLLIQWSIGKGMIEYVNSKEVENLKPLIVGLESEYQKESNWSSLRGKNKKFGDLLFSTSNEDTYSDSEFRQPPSHSNRRPSHNRPPHPESGHRSGPRKPPPEFDRDRSRPEISDRPPGGGRERGRKPPGQANYALLDDAKMLVVGHYQPTVEHTKTPIIVNEEKVGWLVVPKREEIADGYELDFIEQQQSYIWIIALAMMILVAGVSLLLARHLAEPIKLIMRGMHKLTQGDYQQHIDLKRKDELGELSRDFNELAVTLNSNESARKRWLANISHELRTPVAILRGELEAMLDGVRPLNNDNVTSANDEVKHLENLIDDLHQLTSADIGGMHYRKKPVDMNLWLSGNVDKYRSYLAKAGISLEEAIEETPANIFADETRLCQLFENLVNNCIKYSDASLVKISLALSPELVTIKVEDSGIGVPAIHLPHLFEHLYRVDSSRNRKTGGSGLGLSICAHIVAAHQGTIVAEPSALGGLAIVIDFPLIT